MAAARHLPLPGKHIHDGPTMRNSGGEIHKVRKKQKRRILLLILIALYWAWAYAELQKPDTWQATVYCDIGGQKWNHTIDDIRKEKYQCINATFEKRPLIRWPYNQTLNLTLK